MSIQEEFLDNIESDRYSIIQFQIDLDKDISPSMNSFYRGIIAGYGAAVRQMERMYEKHFIDQEPLKEIRKRYPIPTEFQ